MKNQEEQSSNYQIKIAIGLGAIVAFGFVRFMQSLGPKPKSIRVIRNELKVKLSHAINDERYEEAANYRDQINSLSKNI